MIEVSGLDRPGLLYELTSTLSDLNLDITSAHITTFGEKAVDVFYVTDLTNKKITSPQRQKAIRERLLEVLGGRRAMAAPAIRLSGRRCNSAPRALMSAQSRAISSASCTLLRLALLTFLAAFLAPLALHAAWWLSHDTAVAWNQADWSSARLLPPARAKPRRWCTSTRRAPAAGRASSPITAGSWSRSAAPAAYTRYDKVAWGRPVKTNNWAPDARWYGHRPIAGRRRSKGRRPRR